MAAAARGRGRQLRVVTRRQGPASPAPAPTGTNSSRSFTTHGPPAGLGQFNDLFTTLATGPDGGTLLGAPAPGGRLRDGGCAGGRWRGKLGCGFGGFLRGGGTVMGVPKRDSGTVKLDTGVPHIARVYDYWLGGKDNFRPTARRPRA
jgi:S-adenosyl methyltransferase